MPDGPAAPEVHSAAALMTGLSNALKMTECTVVVGAVSGNKAAECNGAAGKCFDLRMSYTLPNLARYSVIQTKNASFPGAEDKSWRAAAVLPENINLAKDCA